MYVDSRTKGVDTAPLHESLSPPSLDILTRSLHDTGLTGRSPRWSSTMYTAEAVRFAWRSCSLANWRSYSSVADPLRFESKPRCICSLGSGYDQGVFSGIVGNEDFLNVVHHPSAGLLGIIVSIYNLGCFTGTIVAFATGDRLGPRKSMWFAMGWIIVSLCQRDSGKP